MYTIVLKNAKHTRAAMELLVALSTGGTVNALSTRQRVENFIAMVKNASDGM